MTYNPHIHKRNSIRLQEYDYSSEGAYFLTICTFQHIHLFGKIVTGNMYLNKFGQIVQSEWEKSATIRAEIELGEFVIMPNHIHAIVFIIDTNSRGVRPNAPTPNKPSYNITTDVQDNFSGLGSKTIGSLMSGFKSSATKQINLIRDTPGEPVWQRNYWDHIIRDDESFEQIEEYIINNPLNWHQDKLFSP